MPLTRRRLLARAVGGGLVIAGAGACDPLGRSQPEPRPSRSPAPDPLLELLAAERALLSQYDAVLASFPGAISVAAVRADHAAHVDALHALVRGPARSMPPVAVPATLATAVSALRAAEVSAAARTAAACVAAPAARAALLGSIAACESAHLVLLR